MLTAIVYLILTNSSGGVVAIPQANMTECRKNAADYVKNVHTMTSPMCINGVIGTGPKK